MTSGLIPGMSEGDQAKTSMFSCKKLTRFFFDVPLKGGSYFDSRGGVSFMVWVCLPRLPQV